MVRIFNHYIHRRLIFQVLFDYGLIVSAVLAAVALGRQHSDFLLSMTATHGFSVATCTFVINIASGFYQQAHNRSFTETLARAGLAALFALPLAYAIFSVLPEQGAGSRILPVAAVLAVAAVLVHRVYAAHASVGRARSRILVLGSGPAAKLVGETLNSSDPSAEVVGFFPAPHEQQVAVLASQILSGQSLAETALRAGVSEIVVAVTERRGGNMPLRDLLDCKIQGIRVSDISTHFEKTLGKLRLDYVNAGWLIFGDGFDQGFFRTAVKRLFDIVSASVLLVVSAPVMLVTMLLIKLESPGPVFYRQQRVGLNGQNFNVVKFRSMRNDAEKDGKPRWATAADDRVTAVGRVIRKLRIDELPQLINVFKGEMSIVGPRPERPFFVERLTQEIPYYAVRHSIKPGVTGWAQVRYHYGATVEDSQEKLQYDLYYVKNHTLFLDLLILFETVAVVLTGKGAR
ncbi:MAG: TIGR03013 family PEP-CTERM/XrtA system glycosyltransferase [Aquincola sp.]|uniref:TIGR03013 family XrtA/PEP-CTERM system glycosyltransferase n=1 Tax=uncultured Aquincola sp. TaxID=886556 RepID=UPI0032B13A48|nr:TIGR03013 family PEP-CTERM/XrtA system glycosyltransferase [Aquincola sp.]